VQGRSFADSLEQSLRRYQNRAIETAKVIEELIQLAKDMRAANARGEALKLSEDELAFYDTLEVNDSAVKVLGEPTLVGIARELVATVKKNVTIDWTVRENVRAQLRVIVKRILRKYGYPPDKRHFNDTVRERHASDFIRECDGGWYWDRTSGPCRVPVHPGPSTIIRISSVRRRRHGAAGTHWHPDT
jgi:hypothetical protein